MTNLNAPRHKLVIIDVNDEEKRITDLIPEDKDATLTNVGHTNNYKSFVVVYNRNASYFRPRYPHSPTRLLTSF
jgi:prolyl oligopeptidase